MTPAPRKPPRPRTPLRAFVTLLWRQALFAIPFALFFGTLRGDGTFDSYVGAFVISLVFAYAIGLALWVTEFVLLPRVDPALLEKRMWIQYAAFGSASMVGAFVAAIVVHLTLVPILGSARSVAMLAMFSVLFCGLFLAIFTAIHFYQKAIEQVRSEQELNLARRIQRSFLLSQFPEMPRLEVHAVNVSSKEVSGDFYDVVPAGEKAFLLAIADVAGKGVPAALLSSMLQASLRTQATSGTSVAGILATINRLVYRSTAVGQFATFFLARVEEDTLRLTFSNAGHNFPVLFRRDGSRETLERGGTVVGILEDADFEEQTVDLRPGDRLLLYTDGLSEAAAPGGELYGDQRLVDRMAALPRELPAREVTERALAGVREFLAGADPGDDMTVLVLRVLEGARDPAARAAAEAPPAAASARVPA